MVDGWRSYSELMQLQTFEERFAYLKLSGTVGEDVFGSLRVIKQRFYASTEWRRLRSRLIVRDMGCDLAVEGRLIADKVVIHHINPITVTDLLEAKRMMTDPENLICTTVETHRAIHYGDASILNSTMMAEREAHDTCPWRKR